MSGLACAEITDWRELTDMVHILDQGRSGNAIFQFLWPELGFSQGTAHANARLVVDFHKPEHRFVKVSSGDGDDVYGYAQWYVHEQGKIEHPCPEVDWHDKGSKKDCTQDFLVEKVGKREVHMGTRPCLVLENIIVKSHRRNKGAGKLALQWGCRLADGLGVETVTECPANAMGYFHAMGFKAIDIINFDMRPYSKPVNDNDFDMECSESLKKSGKVTYILMHRPPQQLPEEEKKIIKEEYEPVDDWV